MWAHVECYEGGLIRVFEDGAEYGDPYSYAFPFRFQDERTIVLEGIAGRAPTASEGRAMLRACAERGWKVVKERRSGARQGWRDISRKRFSGE